MASSAFLPMKTEAWYFTDWNVLEVRWQAGQVGYNEGRPNPLSSTKNAFTEIWNPLNTG